MPINIPKFYQSILYKNRTILWHISSNQNNYTTFLSIFHNDNTFDGVFQKRLVAKNKIRRSISQMNYLSVWDKKLLVFSYGVRFVRSRVLIIHLLYKILVSFLSPNSSKAARLIFMKSCVHFE